MPFAFKVIPSKTSDGNYYILIKVDKAPVPGAYGGATAPFKDWNAAVADFKNKLTAQFDAADSYEMDGKNYVNVDDILKNLKKP